MRHKAHYLCWHDDVSLVHKTWFGVMQTFCGVDRSHDTHVRPSLLRRDVVTCLSCLAGENILVHDETPEDELDRLRRYRAGRR